MIQKIMAYLHKPSLYEESSDRFWDDEHISKGMLEAHLNPAMDGATRNYPFVQQSFRWIAEIAPAAKYPALLDLGCGPGIYAELFDHAGYQVTGMDLSAHSLAYARSTAKAKNLPITYLHGNYLEMGFKEQHDLVTMIYCDFGVLSKENRTTLLGKIYTALKPEGLFIFDVFTPNQYAGKTEVRSWELAQQGFYSAEPHLCLHSLYTYENHTTFCNQHIIITDQAVRCLNIWEHTFCKEELEKDLHAAGFTVKGIYGNIAGNRFDPNGKELCVVAEKRI